MTLPVACTLSTPELAARAAELRTGVLATAESADPIDSGYRWRFGYAPDLLTRLGVVLDAERTCCRFLRVRLESEPDQATTSLEITGPAGTQEFLATWLRPSS